MIDDGTMAELLRRVKAEYKTSRGATLETEQQVKEHCRFFFQGQVFVSHTAVDSDWCQKHIIAALNKRRHGVFFVSLAQDPVFANAYRFMVEYSMYYCKTVIIALSQRSLLSTWTSLEAQWAVSQRHPIIVCRIDDSDPRQLHPALGTRWFSLLRSPLEIISFEQDPIAAGETLRTLMRQREFAPERRPWDKTPA
jgi:hypothetical protein